MSAPADVLVNALAMMCPFEPAEKQALLEAPSWTERVDTLVALLEMSGAPDTERPVDQLRLTMTETDPEIARNPRLPADQDDARYDRERQELISRAAGLAYPIRGGVPIMLAGEARELTEAERSRNDRKQPLADRIAGQSRTRTTLHRRLRRSGERFALAAEYLRVESPSAEVQGHGGDQKTDRRRQAAREDRRRWSRSGNYAVRIRFDDGHDTGLYSWDYLHELGATARKKWTTYLSALKTRQMER